MKTYGPGPGWMDHSTYAVQNAIAVPSGATNYLPPFIYPVPGGQAVYLVGVNAMVRNNGSSPTVTFKIQQNGSDVTGLTGLVCTTSPQTAMWIPSAPVPVNDQDYFAPVVTAIANTPDGLTVSFFFEYQL